MTQPGVGAPFALAGGLQVRPGVALGRSLLGTRPNWAPRLARGQLAADLPGLMASLFNLCSHAHRLACQLALDVLLPPGAPALRLDGAQLAERLRHETAAEHIRRMGLDWPRLLAHPADQAAHAQQAEAALRACPLLRLGAGADTWATTLAWLETHWLHLPAADWLAQWQQGRSDWLHEWSAQALARQPHGPAALLHGAQVGLHRVCTRPLDAERALPLPCEPAMQKVLAQALASQAGFAQQPQWQGACAHTGTWTRWRDARAATHDCANSSPWTLLGSRMAELARLCLPDAPGQGSQWLACGAASTGPDQALAWVEMARGVLVYQVALDSACRNDGPRVAACEVLAPTEWNFHPQGEVAQRLSALEPLLAPPAQTERAVRLLMAAFDPCVPFELDMASSSTHNPEPSHA